MEKGKIREEVSHVGWYIVSFLRWFLISIIIGAVSGVIGSVFHIGIERATEFRAENSWIILLLPVGGLAIVGMYQVCHMLEHTGTNQVFDSIRSEGKIPFSLAPLIFVSTIITHLLGGSAGREGAALQLGGSIGSQAGRIFRLDADDMHIAVLCGMSGVFAALFGTPLTAVFFAMEVISVGVIYYSGLVPCVVSALAAYTISLEFGLQPVGFVIENVPDLSVMVFFKVVILSAMCAVVSIAFCVSMSGATAFVKKYLPNPYIRIAAGGAVIVALTYLLGTFDYNGAGMNIVADAVAGSARPEAFLLKLIFTVITISVGYRGGEIVPTFFIGATFGCIAGGLLGLDPGFSAAIGLVALFCGAVNSPLGAIFLSIEMFGGKGILMFAAASAISYVISGYFGLYSSQTILYSKLKTKFINRKTRQI